MRSPNIKKKLKNNGNCKHYINFFISKFITNKNIIKKQYCFHSMWAISFLKNSALLATIAVSCHPQFILICLLNPNFNFQFNLCYFICNRKDSNSRPSIDKFSSFNLVKISARCARWCNHAISKTNSANGDFYHTKVLKLLLSFGIIWLAPCLVIITKPGYEKVSFETYYPYHYT